MDGMLVIVGIIFIASIVSAAVFLISLIVSALMRKDVKKYVKGFWISLLCFGVAFVSGITIGAVLPDAEPTTETTAVTETVIDITAPTETEPEVLGFLDELEYSAEQIEAVRTVLTNVGITEITELEVGTVSYGMQVIKGLAFTTGELAAPKEVRVQFNIENGTIYLVAIYCPSYGTSNQPTYLSGLSDRRADLYYDTEGGYLKKIDWKNKAVVDYN